ncbi:hypothetical protein [uncultured phage cr91_1]|uniref:Uncharacterized protein n=1 Tax=uncultured phage cr91_1 TaxID=2986403 RepID=A0AAE7V2C1_9CAUD|nr:hypothetical protein M1M48_gp14 [uncultured phage cr91_1]QWM89574.1 hypothetical protein [uncultured phage cr91_1]
METVIWVIVLLIGLLIVDVIVLKQRVSKLQEQLNEALKNQVNLRQQVLNLADNALKSAEHIKTLTDNVKRIVDVVHEHINSSDDK